MFVFRILNSVIGQIDNAMVRLSGKSYEHLSRSMKKYKNMTLSDFINNIRLNHAANLLKYTNLSITDIAIECGYNNISYFPVCFKKKYGIINLNSSAGQPDCGTHFCIIINEFITITSFFYC